MRRLIMFIAFVIVADDLELYGDSPWVASYLVSSNINGNSVVGLPINRVVSVTAARQCYQSFGMDCWCSCDSPMAIRESRVAVPLLDCSSCAVSMS